MFAIDFTTSSALLTVQHHVRIGLAAPICGLSCLVPSASMLDCAALDVASPSKIFAWLGLLVPMPDLSHLEVLLPLKGASARLDSFPVFSGILRLGPFLIALADTCLESVVSLQLSS